MNAGGCPTKCWMGVISQWGADEGDADGEKVRERKKAMDKTGGCLAAATDCIDGELALAAIQFDRRRVQLLRRVVDTNGGESGEHAPAFRRPQQQLQHARTREEH
ncbi:hypothetical protein PRIPAC_82633 [Pristionchus pacificus]|uniref:Uncharacterized protein n=1 Tax=Pristionchus pacificus TaxID=54126 RepID=A0A2A6CLN0_PRIPA|nr:hypothetical protein PRIPAC_82633 [Pristionchus pacificus]|eukprot:PDM78953.1 hypothetical protein PRIPAC_31532 [Pristionchus pacificus]